MRYKFFIILLALQLFGCADHPDETDGIKLEQVTYTIQVEDTSHRFLRQEFIAPYSLTQYYAFLVERSAYDPTSNNTAYTIRLRSIVTDEDYILNVIVGGDGFEYRTYTLIANQAPNISGQVFLMFLKVDDPFREYQYRSAPSQPYKFEVSKLNDICDIVRLSYITTNSLGAPLCKFNAEFYIRH